MLTRYDHWRGAKAVLREHPRDSRAIVQFDNQQILAIGALDSGLGNAKRNPGHRQQILRHGRG
jgi:hypothetical protein